MKRTEMIKDKKIFSNLIKNASFKKNNFYIIYYERKNEIDNKYGIAISNKIGKANVRNRLKRQTRAIIDKNRNLFSNNHNYIIMIRKSCLNVSFQDLEDALKDLIEKTG